MIGKRRAVHGWIRRWWEGRAGYTGRLLRLLLRPAEMAYRTALAVRDAAYRLGFRTAREAPIPVLSVGNVSVGGTGKTPFAAWLAERLAEEGVTPAIVLRGYGDDESHLHARWNPDVPVHVARRRLDAVTAAAAGGADVAILDDGFQHRELARDADVVLLAAEDPLPPRLLPLGPYREPLEALRRAHLVVVTRRTASEGQALALEDRIRAAVPGTPRIGRIRLEPGGWRTVDGEVADEPAGAVLAVAGVARPRSFGDVLEPILGERPDVMDFPDHHDFTAADVDAILAAAGDRTIVTTEKDAVKLVDYADRLPDARVLALRVTPEGKARLLDVLVTSIVARVTLELP